MTCRIATLNLRVNMKHALGGQEKIRRPSGMRGVRNGIFANKCKPNSDVSSSRVADECASTISKENAYVQQSNAKHPFRAGIIGEFAHKRPYLPIDRVLFSQKLHI